MVTTKAHTAPILARGDRKAKLPLTKRIRKHVDPCGVEVIAARGRFEPYRQWKEKSRRIALGKRIFPDLRVNRLPDILTRGESLVPERFICGGKREYSVENIEIFKLGLRESRPCFKRKAAF